MENVSFILETLKNRAQKTNPKMLDKLESKEFVDSLIKVLSIFEELNVNLDSKRLNDSYVTISEKIAKALVCNYIAIYYVNMDTGLYTGFSSNSGYGSLRLEEEGDDFFADVRANIQNVIYKDDKDRLLKLLTKENIDLETENGKHFYVNYRLMIDGKPTYVSLNAIKIEEAEKHLVIGISDIDVQKRKEIELNKKMESNITYSNIALALATSFLSIFYINVENNKYIEYNLDNETQTLSKVRRGNDVFGETIINGKKLIHKEDVNVFLKSLEKDNLLKELGKQKRLRLTYRLKKDDDYVYTSLVALPLIQDTTHIIIGISDIDKQKRQELAFLEKLDIEKNIARTDALTGAMNKYKYNEMEKIIDDKIKSGSPLEFSVVVCDINNLKIINDTKGHTAGDKYIVDAKKILEDIFKNTTIYRIGGDEFVLLLDGSDYYKREHLLKALNDINEENKNNDKVVIACGMSDYNKNKDDSVKKVFNRADNLMYKNKLELKK